MKSLKNIIVRVLFLTLLVGVILPATVFSQNKKVLLKTVPDPISVVAGETIQVKVNAVDEEGNQLEKGNVFFFPLRESGLVPTSGMEIDSTGLVKAYQPGVYNLVVARRGLENESFTRIYTKITVTPRPVAKIEIDNVPQKIYEGSGFQIDWHAYDAEGNKIEGKEISLASGNADILTVDNFNNLNALKPGNTILTGKVDQVTTDLKIRVVKNPIVKIKLEIDRQEVRTGDVVRLKAQAWDKNDQLVSGVPFNYSFFADVSEKASGSAGVIDQNGRFVAEKPGTYTLMVTSGDRVARQKVRVNHRFVSRKIELVGKGLVSSKHTSDFWVWEGVDGKDYAVTGTWGADGKAYFWEVTDPSALVLIDSVQVDARTVNDVKVSEDSKICVISREGASNRKNGIVILDVSNPGDVSVISTYTDQLTGGVHNLFIYKNHVYALSNGQRYDVINIEDPENPRKVGKFELPNPARAIHDVWVEDGIAYSSNWNDGVVMVDVGNGLAGGTPSNPVEIARSRVEGDANHAAFPFKSESTGKFYVVAGDEIFPLEFMDDSDALIAPSGYLHFIDFTDKDNPKEVARYEVPGAGSHNFWIEGDTLYVGYYNGGVRVVDISGELMGDLYRQGREIAHYLPQDKDGYIPNAPMTWGAQPYKGHIFMSDFNSGLWAVKLSGEQPAPTNIRSK